MILRDRRPFVACLTMDHGRLAFRAVPRRSTPTGAGYLQTARACSMSSTPRRRSLRPQPTFCDQSVTKSSVRRFRRVQLVDLKNGPPGTRTPDPLIKSSLAARHYLPTICTLSDASTAPPLRILGDRAPPLVRRVSASATQGTRRFASSLQADGGARAACGNHRVPMGSGRQSLCPAICAG